MGLNDGAVKGQQPGAPITTVMVALAWAILHGPEDWTVARALAKQVLDASDRP